MSDASIAIVGNLNVDQIIGTVKRFPAWDEELMVDSSRLELAGTAGYLAAAAQSLGMAPFVVSTVGDDDLAAFLDRELAAAGIDRSGVETLADLPTCLSVIFVGEQGKRSILTVLGAHAEMSPAIAEKHDERIGACAEVFLCGNYLLPKFGPADSVPYARMLRQRGQTVAFDPSWDPTGWEDASRDATYDLLREVDVFLPNDAELCAFTRESDWRAALATLTDVGGEIVLKRGAAGAVFLRQGQIEEVEAPAVTAVNTIGAGDVFDIAYLYGRRQQWDPQQRLRFACATAALVIQQPGKRRYPTPEDVFAFLNDGAFA